MKIVLVSSNAGTDMGGEAIKAYQYFDYLLRQGYDAVLLTHARNRRGLSRDFPAERLLFVEDGPVQRTLWQSRFGAPLVSTCFHLLAARLIRARFDPAATLLHYLCPVSPVEPRFPPQGFETVMGPFTGNIHYPPDFADRETSRGKLRARLHRPAQLLFRKFAPDKRQARHVLVSGYARTRRSLAWAGVPPERMSEVVDSGVAEAIAARPPARHVGRSTEFACSGRQVDHKGTDLAIRAVAESRECARLTVYGDGPARPALEGLARELGVSERVRFAGWRPHGEVLDGIAAARGYVFPSLAEANGIVMQEAMMLGVPVLALRWGGPGHLASDDAALYVEPGEEAAVVAGLAAGMDRLICEPDFADGVARRARAIAEARFAWSAVAASWAACYPAAARQAAAERRAAGIVGDRA
ncbi:glycosyltransferase family 4 protein [Limimaricola variabilis]|uniref:glycosyltransferase family 4 protein n=1 Tax=Limimaricola variabilis TaxID=1492771 RepID=UPI002AC98719|nr:glycosyltransferase family 4 protein [Limimaricola variabilis]WPY93887.1 glycosyltransferase family 4 protein [Limimaricola variabilis]